MKIKTPFLAVLIALAMGVTTTSISTATESDLTSYEFSISSEESDINIGMINLAPRTTTDPAFLNNVVLVLDGREVESIDTMTVNFDFEGDESAVVAPEPSSSIFALLGGMIAFTRRRR